MAISDSDRPHPSHAACLSVAPKPPLPHAPWHAPPLQSAGERPAAAVGRPPDREAALRELRMREQQALARLRALEAAAAAPVPP